VFWALLLILLALGQRYPWLYQVWYGAWMLFLLVVSVYAVIQIFRQRDERDGHVGGVPRWVVTLFGDEVDPPRKTTNRPE
jgi:hypothetical protein